jgi:hypothetical protein
MSMLFGPASSDPLAGGLPRGEVLGTYPTYLEARKLVDRLAEQDFNIRTVSIVGTDLRTVERIRNRLTYPMVALRSAVQGAFFGLMIGILMTLIDPSGSGFQILYTVGLGVAIWVIFGVIGHSMRKGRGVDSVQQLVPTSFDVVCEFESAAQAKQLLGRSAPSGPAPAPPLPGPTPAPAPPSAPQRPMPPQDPTANPSDAGGRPVGEVPDPGAPRSEDAAPIPAAPPASHPAPNPVLNPPAAAGSEPQQRHGAYSDLPDGRPQFGVRLPEEEAKVVRDQVLKDNASKHGQPGQGTGTFEAPAYAKGKRGAAGDASSAGGAAEGAAGPAAGNTADTTAGSGRRSDPHRPVDGGTEPAEGDRPTSGTGDGDETFERPRYGRRAAVKDTHGGTDTTPEPEQRD